MLRKCFGLNGDHFVKYVVCPHCNSLYELEKCFESCDVLRTTHKLCTFTPFPKHPQPLKRKPCGHQLFKEIVLKSGKKSYYPLKVYCYKSLTESLATLQQRDGIIDFCEHGRQRQMRTTLQRRSTARIQQPLVNINCVRTARPTKNYQEVPKTTRAYKK